MIRKLITVPALAIAFAFSPFAFAANDRAADASDGHDTKVVVVAQGNLLRMSDVAIDSYMSDIGDHGLKPALAKFVGRQVYTDDGKRRGVVERFGATADGRVYAIIDRTTGFLEDSILKGDDVVLVAAVEAIELANKPGANPSRER